MDIAEDGWPPASVESLWAVDLGDGTVRLDNTPWFVRGVASGDIIQAELDGDGVRRATGQPIKETRPSRGRDRRHRSGVGRTRRVSVAAFRPNLRNT
ncbi:DUF4265 domain-containing protein [Streptomyces sp. SBC-4]|nr:DUF4265 domain-containing protein [Streptomyces sp. SBC-4]MDV5143157.1 DUF4265 domain-containing protein [Streptomyces sp. SBC-4]